MNQEEILEVEISKIKVNPYQPRKHFIDNELQELAESIAAVGIIQPPVVRKIADHFELISGERRFRAAQLAGLKTIKVLLRHGNDIFSARAALIENIQRVDLNPIEIAKALRSLSHQENLNQEELASRIGKKRSTVANYLRLLSLPLQIQESVIQGDISMGHAKAILSLESEENQLILHKRVLEEQLTVRQTELVAHKLSKVMENSERKKRPMDIHLKNIVDELQHKFGTKISIQGSGNKGTINIDYYNLEDLDRLLNLFGVNLN